MDTVCVDFDGTLADQDMEPIPGAVPWLHSLTRRFQVVILTSRGASGQAQIRDWLVRRAGLVLKVTSTKPQAVAYIDNKAYRFEGVYPSVEELVEGSRLPVRAPAAAARVP